MSVPIYIKIYYGGEDDDDDEMCVMWISIVGDTDINTPTLMFPI